MRTRRSYFPITTNVTIPRRRQRKQNSNIVEPEIRTIVEMADNRTMTQMLQAPIEEYEDAIVVPPINANNFELKQTLINLVQNLLRQCPHHGFSELHQLDTFYNALNPNDQDALDSAARGNFLDKIPQECLSIIESKSKVRYSRSHVTDSRVSINAPLPSSSPSHSFDLQQIATSLEDKLDIRMNRFKKSLNDMKASFVTPTAPIKAVEEVCVMCGANHSYNRCLLTHVETNSRSFTIIFSNSRPPRLEISFKEIVIRIYQVRYNHQDSTNQSKTTKTVIKGTISIPITIRIVKTIKEMVTKTHHNKLRPIKHQFHKIQY
nr:reverse transcriptase domain-containing protein [Tanacetum cinerariifolium]